LDPQLADPFSKVIYICEIGFIERLNRETDAVVFKFSGINMILWRSEKSEGWIDPGRGSDRL